MLRNCFSACAFFTHEKHWVEVFSQLTGRPLGDVWGPLGTVCTTLFIVTAITALIKLAEQIDFVLNLSKPTGQVMHQQFNIQQLYVLPTLYLCVLYLTDSKQRRVPLTA